MSWEKLVEKAEKDREVALALFTELSEKVRHLQNLMVGVAGLYLAVLALGFASLLLHVAVALLIAGLLRRMRKWRMLLTRVENIVSGDPVMSLRKWLDRYGDELIATAIAVSLYLIGLLHSLGLIP